MKDVLLQTRVPSTVAREVKRRAADQGDSDAAWLRRLLVRETGEALDGEFFDLGDTFIRKSSIVAMKWVDPHAGTCAEGDKPWKLRVDLVCGASWTLGTESAQIVLKAFGLPTKNPHPKGDKS